MRIRSDILLTEILYSFKISLQFVVLLHHLLDVVILGLADVHIRQSQVHPELVSTHLQHCVQITGTPHKYFSITKLFDNMKSIYDETALLISLAPRLLALVMRMISLKRKMQRSFLIQGLVLVVTRS